MNDLITIPPPVNAKSVCSSLFSSLLMCIESLNLHLTLLPPPSCGKVMFSPASVCSRGGGQWMGRQHQMHHEITHMVGYLLHQTWVPPGHQTWALPPPPPTSHLGTTHPRDIYPDASTKMPHRPLDSILYLSVSRRLPPANKV